MVTPGDAKALAAAVNSLMDDKGLRRRLGEAGRARAAAEFSAEVMLARHLELYLSLMEDDGA